MSDGTLSVHRTPRGAYDAAREIGRVTMADVAD